MDSLMQLLQGFETALTWSNLLYCLLGVTIGMLVGVLPGLGPTTGTAILLPVTFSMEPVSAIIMLAGIYYGAMYGGTITSVLINTPGEAASVITCLDGHPLAKQGRAGTALGVAGIGSFIGGTVSIIGLVVIGPPLAQFALRFGPPEFFALMLLGLITVVGLMGKSIVNGIISALLGLCLALIGMDVVSGAIRFTFDEPNLMNGIDFVIISMGLFGLSEIMIGMENITKLEAPPKVKGLLPRRDEWRRTLSAIGRGTGLGFLVGLVPGSNSVIPAILSYSLEKKNGKRSVTFRQRSHRRGCRAGNSEQFLQRSGLNSAVHIRNPELSYDCRIVRSLYHAWFNSRPYVIPKQSRRRMGNHCQHVHRESDFAGFKFTFGRHVGQNCPDSREAVIPDYFCSCHSGRIQCK